MSKSLEKESPNLEQEKVKKYTAHNMNGSETGYGKATQREDGRWDVSCSFGRSWGGGIDDSGKTYEGTTEDPDKWMKSYGLESDKS